MRIDLALPQALTALAVSLTLALLTAPTQAEPSSSEAVAEARRNEAKRRFERGVEQYRAGRYADAVVAFLQADRLAPSPALSFNVARAYERLDDTSGALRWYRDYLRRSPDAKNAGEVKQRITSLAARLAQTGLQQVSVLSMPDGATVRVDGRAVGVTPFTGELKPGRHLVLLDRAGYRDERRELVLSPKTPSELSVTLEPQQQRVVQRPPGPSSTKAEPKQGGDRGSDRRFGSLPWFITGGGVAGLGGAIGFELARRGEEKAARNADSQLDYKRHLDDSQQHQTRARVLVGVGGGLLLTGGVMLLFNDERSERSTRVALACTPRGCSAAANGSF